MKRGFSSSDPQVTLSSLAGLTLPRMAVLLLNPVDAELATGLPGVQVDWTGNLLGRVLTVTITTMTMTTMTRNLLDGVPKDLPSADELLLPMYSFFLLSIVPRTLNELGGKKSFYCCNF